MTHMTSFPCTAHLAFMRAKSLQLCPSLCIPMDWSPPGSSVYRFSRQGYWNELPLPSPGDLLNSGTEPTSLTSSVVAGRFFTTGASWEAGALHRSVLNYMSKHTGACFEEREHEDDLVWKLLLWISPSWRFGSLIFRRLRIEWFAEKCFNLPI